MQLAPAHLAARRPSMKKGTWAEANAASIRLCRLSNVLTPTVVSRGSRVSTTVTRPLQRDAASSGSSSSSH